MGALNTAAKLINGLLAAAEANESNKRSRSPSPETRALPAVAQQLMADTEAAVTAAGAEVKAAASQATQGLKQAVSHAAGDADELVSEMLGEGGIDLSTR